jgi:dTDP-4-amino-4,6-dideoxygalactose transaminase
MTEMQSAIGICQLEKMESWSRIRERNAGIYINAVKDIELINTPVIPMHLKHAWYKLYLTLNPQLLKKSFTRTKIIDELNHQLVPCSFGGSGQMYQEHAFFGSTYKKDGFLLNASFLEKNSLMLLVHPTISREESIRRAKVLKSVLQHAQK